MMYVGIAYLVILATAATDSAGGIVREKEAQTFDMLVLTNLSPKEILLEKALGSLPGLIFWFGLLLFHLSVFVVFGGLSPLKAMEVLIIIIGPAFFLICTGVYFSLRARQIRKAQGNNQALGLLIFLFLTVFFLLLGSDSSVFPIFVSFVNPIVGAMTVLVDDLELIPEFPCRSLVLFLTFTVFSLLYVRLGIAAYRRGIKQFYRHSVQYDDLSLTFVKKIIDD